MHGDTAGVNTVAFQDILCQSGHGEFAAVSENFGFHVAAETLIHRGKSRLRLPLVACHFGLRLLKKLSFNVKLCYAVVNLENRVYRNLL